MLRKIFVPTRVAVTGEWRKLYREELNDLYCSPNTIRVRYAENVTHMKETRTAYRAAVGKEGDRFKDLDVDGMTILKRILNKLDWIA